LAGVVVDPFPHGIEQVFAAAGLVLAYQKRLTVSLRPAVLFNSQSLYVRVPLMVEVPLFGNCPRDSRSRASPTVAAVGGAGVSTWDVGTETDLLPLLSVGVETHYGSALITAFLSGVLRDKGFDLTADLFLGCLWELK
jgi:hypothetical protein